MICARRVGTDDIINITRVIAIIIMVVTVVFSSSLEVVVSTVFMIHQQHR